MPEVGAFEILAILIVALVVFGPNKLPELARSVGKGLRELRRFQTHLRAQLDDVFAEPPPTVKRPGARDSDHPEGPERPDAAEDQEGSEESRESEIVRETEPPDPPNPLAPDPADGPALPLALDLFGPGAGDASTGTSEPTPGGEPADR